MNELIRSAVEVVLHRHVIVNVDLGLGPVGQLEGGGRQRQKPAFFQRLKPTVARAFQLLKGLRVQLGQERAEGGVQLAQVEKPLVAQRRQNLPLGNEHGPLDLGLVPRFFDARGNDHGAIVFGHFLVTAVQQRFITTRTNDPGLKIIGHSDPGHPLEKGIRVAMGRNPSGQLFIGESLHVSFIAGPQHRHKQVGRRHAAVLGVMDLHLLAGPVHKHLLAGNMHLPQHRLQGARPAPIQLAEAAIAITPRLSLAIFLPQPLERHGLAGQFLMNGGPVRQGWVRLAAGRRRRRSGQQPLEQLLFTLAFRQRPTKARRLRPLEVIAHGAGGQTATAGYLPNR